MSAWVEKGISFVNYMIHGTDFGYTSFVFMGCLAVFFVVYFLLRAQAAKRIWILAANLVFYAWSGSISALVIVIATALIVYGVSVRIERIYARSESKRIDPGLKKEARRYLLLALFLILAVWVYVKVGRTFDLEVVESFQEFSLLKTILVPLGISYYSLSAIGYLLDVYWKKTVPEHNFLTLFTVMIYFPHIVQGPISRYQKLTDQMHHLPGFDYTRVCYGLQLMLYGYIKKMVLADRIALFTGPVFTNYKEYGGVVFVVALVLSVFQIYMDFSGCVDIALGISQVIGIKLDPNFNHPFFSRSAEEFWRRWHITLGTWFKDYVYFPILVSPHYKKWNKSIKNKYGAGAGKVFATMLPLGVVWILIGLWHGTGLNYILWGAYYGIIIISSVLIGDGYHRLSERLKINTDSKAFHLFQCLRTGFIFLVGRLLTAPATLSASWYMAKSIFTTWNPWALFDGTLLNIGLAASDFVIIAAGFVFILVISLLQEQGSVREMISKRCLPIRWALYIAAILAILLLGIYGAGYDASAFIYGQF